MGRVKLNSLLNKQTVEYRCYNKIVAKCYLSYIKLNNKIEQIDTCWRWSWYTAYELIKVKRKVNQFANETKWKYGLTP